jgi:hypothetical protein
MFIRLSRRLYGVSGEAVAEYAEILEAGAVEENSVSGDRTPVLGDGAGLAGVELVMLVVSCSDAAVMDLVVRLPGRR